MIGSARRITGIAHADDTVIEIARGEYCAGIAYVGRASGDYDGIDSTHAQLQVEIGLKERAPALLEHHDVARGGSNFRRDFGAKGPGMEMWTDRLVRASARCEIHISVGQAIDR